MDEIYEFLIAYRAIVGAVLLTMVVILALKVWWEEVCLFVKSAWYSFPIIGKTARLSRKTRRADKGWFQSEIELCTDFYKNYREVRSTPQVYRKSASYLSKVNEIGRSPLSNSGWIAISVLVFIEALGFSYVLAGWTIPGASEATQMAGAFGISIVISILLVMLTHFTGHELYVRGMVSAVRSQWAAHRNAKNITSRAIRIDNNSDDDDEPHYVQTGNRLNVRADMRVRPPIVTILTITMVILVAAGATYVRQQKLEQMLLEETTLSPSSGPAFGFPSLNKTPDVFSNPQKAAEQKAAEEVTTTKRKGGLVTFAVLAVLFVFIQIVGVLLGFKTGFAGKESKKAWRVSHKFTTEEDYVDYHRAKMDVVANVAQGHLSRLQARMDDRIAATGIEGEAVNMAGKAEDRSFNNFVVMKEKDDARRHAEPSGSAEVKSTVVEEPNGKRSETREEMEARIRAELLQEQAAQKEETEEEMRARLRRELSARPT